jgi:uncharacterized metal-binding protein YceD (DUF177 family)
MSYLDHFSLPYKGLKDGLHRFQFEANDTYFACFEDSPVPSGKILVDLNLDKRSRTSILDFTLSGYVDTECDRCLANIRLPIHGKYTLHVKISVDDHDDIGDDIIFLHPDAAKLDLAVSIYEMIVLSLPMIKAYDCEKDDPKPCNEEILAKIGVTSDENSKLQEDSQSLWSDLLNLNLDK